MGNKALESSLQKKSKSIKEKGLQRRSNAKSIQNVENTNSVQCSRND